MGASIKFVCLFVCLFVYNLPGPWSPSPTENDTPLIRPCSSLQSPARLVNPEPECCGLFVPRLLTIDFLKHKCNKKQLQNPQKQHSVTTTRTLNRVPDSRQAPWPVSSCFGPQQNPEVGRKFGPKKKKLKCVLRSTHCKHFQCTF